MWIEGWYGGRWANASASNNVYSTADGHDWKSHGKAPWAAREAAAGVVFQNKLVIIGGIKSYYHNTEADLLNDVWASADGDKWECLTSRAAWAPRAYHQAAVMGQHIFLMGGGNYYPVWRDYSDVWRTADGIWWHTLTPAAPWVPRIWFGLAVLTKWHYQALVLTGGCTNHSTCANPAGCNHNDTWTSTDGKTWVQLETSVAYPTRHAFATWVLDGKIYTAAGDHSPHTTNSLWRLDI